MDQAVNVAVVRGEDRRGAVAQALALIADDLRRCVAPTVTILPRPRGRGLPHADALSATLDALFHAGASEAVVLGAAEAWERAGYRREAFGRSVTFVTDEDGCAAAEARCLVALIDKVRPGGPSEASPRVARPPRLSIIDAFDAKRTVIAGTDAVAVGVLAAAVLGVGGPSIRPWHIRVLGDPVLEQGPPGRGSAPSRPHFGAIANRQSPV